MFKFAKKWMTILTSTVLFLCVSAPMQTFAVTDTNGHWAQNVINKWISLGYMNGYPDGTFRPDSPISRAEFVVLINKSYHVIGGGTIEFGDVPTDFWAYDEIRKGVSNGYVIGNGDGTFSPNDMVSRQEAAVMIANIKGLPFNTSNSSDYKDNSSISDWARSYVGAVTNAQIMKGFPDGTFHPMGNMTRAEAVTALDMALASHDLPAENNENSNNSSNDNTVTNFTMNKNQTSLKNDTITGDFIIPENASENITLENITVNGNVLIEGGKNITIKNSVLKQVVIHKSDVVLESNQYSQIKEVQFKENAKIVGKGFQTIIIDGENVESVAIDAEVDTVFLDTGAKLKLLANANIQALEATTKAQDTTITFIKGAKVEKMLLRSKLNIIGKGSIDTMTVYESGIKSEIKPDIVNLKDGSSKPTYTNSSSSSSSSSSGGSSSGYSNLTLDTKNKKFDGNGNKYADVKIDNEGIKLTNCIITGDLTIGRNVGNGTVTLENLEVQGNTYIYGGGKNSIVLNNCNLKGDIISDVSDKNISSGEQKEPVALKFDSHSIVSGKLKILGSTILQSLSSTKIKLPNVTIDTQFDEEISLGIDITNLDINQKSKISLKDGTYINTVNAWNNAGESEFIFHASDAKIGILNAYSAIKLSGNGTVETINAYVDISIGADVKYNNIVKPNEQKVTGVSMNSTATSLTLGETYQLTATVTPANATNKKVTWSSDNEAVATVDQTGKVKALTAGKANITATTEDGNKTAVCKITVTDKIIAVTGVSLNETKVDMTTGGTYQLAATVTPANATNKKVTWSSDNEAVATVDQTGKVKALTAGKANITATTEDGNKTAVCKIIVTIAVTGISLNETVVQMNETEVIQLRANVIPADATIEGIEWSSDNEAIATVDQTGLVRALKPGTAIITAKVKNQNYQAACTITVANTIPVENFYIVPASNMEIIKGSNFQYTAIVQPPDATIEGIEWSSDNEAVATVDQTGLVTGMSEGRANITAKIKNQNYEMSVGVRIVLPLVEKIELNPTTAQINENESVQLQSIITPPDATIEGIEWSSDNEAVAIVDQTGLVTGVKTGTATITAKTKNNNRKATCVITVNANTPVKNFYTTPMSDIELPKGDSDQYEASEENKSVQIELNGTVQMNQ